VNYYKRHIGDYARKTRHLSILEHGVYTLILDAYYDRERPLSETEAIRFAGARSDDELRAVKNVLAEFFSVDNGLFFQAHADEVIAEFHKRQKTNRKLGAIGGKRNAKRNASESLSETEANDKPSARASIKPLATRDQEHVQQAARFADFWAAYPIKRGKKAALAKWKARRLDGLADELIADVRKRIAGDEQWRRGFAPHPLTYLNQDRWEDELGSPAQQPQAPQPAQRHKTAEQTKRETTERKREHVTAEPQAMKAIMAKLDIEAQP
jgi:uncharacterized protein YdaU (DUF1376 family)